MDKLELYIHLAVWIPFIAAAAICVSPRPAREPLTYIAAIATLASTLALLPPVLAGERPSLDVLQLIPNVGLTFHVDALGITFALLASALWGLVSIYNRGYVRDTHLQNQRRYYACFAASIGAATGLALAGNLLTFLLFYELLTLATFPLVAHQEKPESLAGARRYLAYALSGGLLLTTAVVWTWTMTGTLAFSPGGFLHGQASSGTLNGLFALFIIGCGVKAAIMPLHAWLPAAMVAPTPVSALLHAVAVVKAGVFGCLRVLSFVFGPESLNQIIGDEVLMVFCGVTIVVGSLLAMRQDHLKRRLAFSTIVHLSYIVLGAALMTPLGTIGAIFHLVNHGLTKITLFLCAGSIHATTHVDYISQMRGLGRRMPWTFTAFTVATLSLIGVPGLCGFVSKLLLIRGAWEGDWLIYLGIMLGASLFTAAYLLPVVCNGFFEKPKPSHQEHDAEHDAEHDGHGSHGDARPSIRLSLIVAAGLVVVFGLIPMAIMRQYDLAKAVASRVFGAE